MSIGPRTREPLRWSDETIRRFAERWNAGEASEVLREVYGRPPSMIARHLWTVRGVFLKDRRPRKLSQ